MTFDLPDQGPGRIMRHPYTAIGRMFGFPWKHYWTKGRAFKYVALGLLATIPIIYPISKAVNSPGNIEVWKEIRAKRRRDPFAPPTLTGGHH